MSRPPTPLALFVAAVLMAVWLCPTAASAQVHDNAHLFSSGAVSRADSAIEQMQRQYNRGLVVETIPSVPANDRAAVQQDKAAFFKRFTAGRFRDLDVRGVYVLICMDPPFVDIKPDRETAERDFTEADTGRLSKQVRSDLGEKREDQALSDAVDGVQQSYQTNLGSSVPPANDNRGGATGRSPAPFRSNAAPTGVAGSSILHTFGCGTLLCLGVGIIVVFALVRGLLGRRGGSSGGMMQTGGPTYPMGGGTGYTPGYTPPVAGGGGGFGRGLLGGLLGGAVGSYAADKFEHRGDTGSAMSSMGGGDPGAGGFGGGGDSPGFDPTPADAGQAADFGGGGDPVAGGFGGGDVGGGDSGGGDPGAGGF